MKKLRPIAVEIVNESGEYLGRINISAKDAKALIEILGIDKIKGRQDVLWWASACLWTSYMLHLFVYHDAAGTIKDGYDYICGKLYKALKRKEKRNV